jgi:hypothetical protein
VKRRDPVIQLLRKKMDRRVTPGDDTSVDAAPLSKLARTLQTRVSGFAILASWSMSAMPCSIEGVVDRDVG